MDSKFLSKKVVLITGGGGSLGSGIAAACAEAGAQVFLTDRDQDALVQTETKLRSQGVQVASSLHDVSAEDGWDQVYDAAAKKFGPVQVLFNNAGVSALGRDLVRLDLALWNAVLSINVTAVLIGMQKLAQRLVGDGLPGHIVNVSSIAGLGISVPGSSAYVTSKAAIVALSEVAQNEFRQHHIGVSVACPGPVRSKLWQTSREVLGLPPLSAPPEASRAGSASPDAMDPNIAGKRIVQGMLDGKFFLFTHPGAFGIAEPRYERLRREALAECQSASHRS